MRPAEKPADGRSGVARPHDDAWGRHALTWDQRCLVPHLGRALDDGTGAADHPGGSKNEGDRYTHAIGT